jgi:hypothetical protein
VVAALGDSITADREGSDPSSFAHIPIAGRNNGNADREGSDPSSFAHIPIAGRDNGHAVAIAWHDALEDPDAPGLMRAALTADGGHPPVEGYRILGELVARALD